MNAMRPDVEPVTLIAELEALHHKAENLAVASPSDFQIEGRVLDVLIELGVAEAEIDYIVFPDGRPTRRTATPDLSLPHSDRACRFARVVRFAEQVFGNHQKAFLWLRASNTALQGRTPIGCIGTETGARAVEELLARIDFGVAA